MITVNNPQLFLINIIYSKIGDFEKCNDKFNKSILADNSVVKKKWCKFNLEKYKIYKSIYYLLNKNFNDFFMNENANIFMNLVYHRCHEIVPEIDNIIDYLNDKNIKVYLPILNCSMILNNNNSKYKDKISYFNLVKKTVIKFKNLYQNNIIKIYLILLKKIPFDVTHYIVNFLFKFDKI